MKIPAGIDRQHLSRKAIVYTRQSTERQVIEHTGSSTYQRDQAEYARSYGWGEEQIQHIEDLGFSGSTVANREGYQRLLEEIAEDRVGGVFVHDISRLNRNSFHFQYLLTRCRECDVLVFEDGRIMDPKDALDSFMATIRAEVAQLENLDRKKKMQDGRRARVKSGYAVSAPPIGYVANEKGKWEKHEDENVRRVITLIFENAVSLPSIYAVWNYLVEKNIQVPVKTKGYFRDHKVRWKDATYAYLTKMLSNPNYTAHYWFGREKLNPKAVSADGNFVSKEPKRIKRRPKETLMVKNHHEKYVDCEVFQSLREKYSKKRITTFQPVREGENILQGIIFCAHCGRRMSSKYSVGPKGLRYYTCGLKYKPCKIYGRMIRAEQIDEEAKEALFRAISKPNVDYIIGLYEVESRRAFRSIDEHELILKQAKVAVLRAEETYKAVDPANRLVKAKLEREWQAKLEALEQLENSPPERPAPPPPLTKQQKERLSFLCENFSQAFSHPAVDLSTKKRLVRCLVEKAVITREDDLILVDLHWQGRKRSKTLLTVQTPRYVNRYIRDRYHEGLDEDEIIEAMRAME